MTPLPYGRPGTGRRRPVGRGDGAGAALRGGDGGAGDRAHVRASEANDTASPEVALAVSGITWLTAAVGGCPKVIICEAFVPWLPFGGAGPGRTAKDRCMSRAAAKRSSRPGRR